MGDFNIPSVNEINFNFHSNSTITALMSQLINAYSLKSFDDCSNEDNKTLDLVLSNSPMDVREEFLPLAPIDPKHPALTCEITLTKNLHFKHTPYNSSVMNNLKQANFPLLTKLLCDVYWTLLGYFGRVNDQVK
ncbi:hypothetical protein JTB14_008893 [Gonioctena quinquepunctata]|nr:hypothetical protein JTB14_008893 [Gonioctena quinquepunctata]